MPHYKDGTEAKYGDIAKGKDWNGEELKGFVVGISPGSDFCNLTLAAPSLSLPAKVEDGKVVPCPTNQPNVTLRTQTMNAKDCEKIA